MDVSQELINGMQINLHRQHWKRTQSSLCLMICTPFQGHSRSWIKWMPPWNVLGGSGERFLFSLERLMYFHCYLTMLDRYNCHSQGSVYYYMTRQSQIFTGFYQKIIRPSTSWMQSIMILAQGLLQIFCSTQIVFEIPCWQMHKFSKGHNSGIIWRKLFESYLDNPLIISNQVTKFQGPS